MSQRTDAEFEHIINDPGAAPAPAVESDDAKHLREELDPPHAVEANAIGELPKQSQG
jgi:hypothetical protein